ncbi:MAG: hypothetical protein K9H49_10200 [Bacteroidales bacterium]|nr:hypothetical protein [Bacteroidales bacterium]MCF8389736.1 hypothetical protein [Bacteroidales bacterium]
MDKAYLYIKKLIALVLSFFVMIAVSRWMISLHITNFEYADGIYSGINIFSVTPLALLIGFLVLSFLHFKITGLKPHYLYGLKKADDHLNKKGGFWLLFKWIFSLFGLVYDILAWSVNGVYAFFLIVIDFLLLIKTIVYWIIHAIIWFFRLFVPPIVFIYKMVIYYLIRWPWWIYKLTFRNMSHAINKNYYYISLWGGVLTIFLIALFYGLGSLVGIEGVVFIGLIFSVLPLVWSYAEISAIRNENRAEDGLDNVRMKFNSGFEAVRAVLFYVVLFLIGIIAEILLNVLGWIPNIGFSLLGLALNVNTFISLVLLFVFVILVFTKVLMPAHIVHNPDYESNLENTGKFLEVIGKKFLRYLVAHIPGTVFAVLLSIIPAVVVFLGVSLTLELKNGIMESRIQTLEARTYTIELKDKYILEERIDRFNYYKNFPLNVMGDFINLPEYSDRKKAVGLNIVGLKNEVGRVSQLFTHDIDSLRFVVNHLSSATNEESFRLLSSAKIKLENKEAEYKKWQSDKLDEELKMTAELMYVKGMLYQLPVAFLLVVIWMSIFGGLVLAVFISYFGNIYHELYAFKENDEPTYFKRVALELNSKDRNQPLLGFTLIIILIILFAAVPIIIQGGLLNEFLNLLN